MTLRNTLGALFLTTLALTATACGSSGGSSTPAEIHAGASCEGLSASEAVYHCDGQTVLFCSSYTQYEYTEMNTCDEGKTCSVAADKTSATCM